VGVVCFFRAQVSAISARTASGTHAGSMASAAGIHLTVGTIDSFQGGEFDIVLLCTSRSSYVGSSFFNHPARINVAISRAKRHAIVLGNAHAMRAYDGLWRQVMNAMWAGATDVQSLRAGCAARYERERRREEEEEVMAVAVAQAAMEEEVRALQAPLLSQRNMPYGDEEGQGAEAGAEAEAEEVLQLELEVGAGGSNDALEAEGRAAAAPLSPPRPPALFASSLSSSSAESSQEERDSQAMRSKTSRGGGGGGGGEVAVAKSMVIRRKPQALSSHSANKPPASSIGASGGPTRRIAL